MLLLLNQQHHHHWLEKILLSFHRFRIVQYQVLFKLRPIIIIIITIIHFYLFVHRIVLVNEKQMFNLFNSIDFIFSGDLSSTPLLMLDNPISNHCHQQLFNKMNHYQQQHLFNVDHFQRVVHHHLQHQVNPNRLLNRIKRIAVIYLFFRRLQSHMNF